MTKPFAANRRIVALEISNLLRIRRTMARITRELAEGLPPEGLISAGGGRYISRKILLAYARRAFANGLRNVCLARRALFKLTHSETAPVHGASIAEEG